MRNKLFRTHCVYPRGKVTGYYGAEKQSWHATLKIKTAKRAVHLPKTREIQAHATSIWLFQSCSQICRQYQFGRQAASGTVFQIKLAAMQPCGPFDNRQPQA